MRPEGYGHQRLRSLHVATRRRHVLQDFCSPQTSERVVSSYRQQVWLRRGVVCGRAQAAAQQWGFLHPRATAVSQAPPIIPGRRFQICARRRWGRVAIHKVRPSWRQSRALLVCSFYGCLGSSPRGSVPLLGIVSRGLLVLRCFLVVVGRRGWLCLSVVVVRFSHALGARLIRLRWQCGQRAHSRRMPILDVTEDQLWPNLASFWPCWAQLGPHMAQIGRHWPNFGRISARWGNCGAARGRGFGNSRAASEMPGTVGVRDGWPAILRQLRGTSSFSASSGLHGTADLTGFRSPEDSRCAEIPCCPEIAKISENFEA